MTLRFVDAECRPISLGRWQELSRDPTYFGHRLWMETDREWEVEASWVGVHATNHEGEARPFLVRRWKLERSWVKDSDGRTREHVKRVEPKEDDSRWCRTAEKARGLAMSLAMLLREKK